MITPFKTPIKQAFHLYNLRKLFSARFLRFLEVRRALGKARKICREFVCFP